MATQKYRNNRVYASGRTTYRGITVPQSKTVGCNLLTTGSRFNPTVSGAATFLFDPWLASTTLRQPLLDNQNFVACNHLQLTQTIHNPFVPLLAPLLASGVVLYDATLLTASLVGANKLTVTPTIHNPTATLTSTVEVRLLRVSAQLTVDLPAVQPVQDVAAPSVARGLWGMDPWGDNWGSSSLSTIYMPMAVQSSPVLIPGGRKVKVKRLKDNKYGVFIWRPGA